MNIEQMSLVNMLTLHKSGLILEGAKSLSLNLSLQLDCHNLGRHRCCQEEVGNKEQNFCNHKMISQIMKPIYGCRTQSPFNVVRPTFLEVIIFKSDVCLICVYIYISELYVFIVQHAATSNEGNPKPRYLQKYY